MSSVYGGVNGVKVVNSGTINNNLYRGYHAIYFWDERHYHQQRHGIADRRPIYRSSSMARSP